MKIEPPKDWTIDDAGGRYYYGRPGTHSGFMIDVRVWASNNVHIWLPMCNNWCSFSMEEYKEIKVMLEAL